MAQSAMFTLMRFAVTAILFSYASCLDLNVSDHCSIHRTASTIAEGLYAYHNPASTAGQFDQPQPWFWWLSGAGWTSLIDYSVYFNDTTYVSDIHSAISQNVGSNYDFAPAAQAGWEANDDQVYWVYSALTALEYNFPALPCETSDNNTVGDCANSWLALSVHAFEDFIVRWNADAQTCGGGLKWQYNPDANGYTYKNSVSNGGFFQTAARLARYTGNQTYADWATKIWEWSTSVGLVGPQFHVFDGTSDADSANCSSIDHDEWSYNIATYLHGAAHMFAYANGSDTWESRVHGLVSAANTTFFSPSSNATGIMYEQRCEAQSACNTDQASFKGSLSNWMAKTAVLVPSARDDIMSLLRPTAVGAAASCSGLGNSTCGVKWYIDEFDGSTGFGQELAALEAVQSLMVGNAPKLAMK